jgi:endonuclease/exonuclease/phosphatase family metal-dependent hydrolase
MKSDHNPTILVGDFNVASNCSYILNNMGSKYRLAAYDTYDKGIKCTDSIIVSNNIKTLTKETIKTDGTLTDHNMVKLKLQIE